MSKKCTIFFEILELVTTLDFFSFDNNFFISYNGKLNVLRLNLKTFNKKQRFKVFKNVDEKD